MKFINQSDTTFILQNNKSLAEAYGIPTIIQSKTNRNYYISLPRKLSLKDDFIYYSKSNNYTFKLTATFATTWNHHHKLLQTEPYLLVDWGDVLDNPNIKYLLPLKWKDTEESIVEQKIRIGNDNSIIGIFKHKPRNLLTIMSYNTDKDSYGSDHNPEYYSVKDVLKLFTSNALPKPDILMLQETQGYNQSYYTKMLFSIIHGSWYNIYAHEGERNDANAIFISPEYSNLSLNHGEIIYKNQSGWGLVGARNAIYVDIPLSAILETENKGSVRIFNTHLESGRAPENICAASTRIKQFNELLNYPREGISNLIVGGDLNTLCADGITGLRHYKHGDLISVFDSYIGNSAINRAQPITCTWSTCHILTAGIGMWLDHLYANRLSMTGYKTHILYPMVGHSVDGRSDHLPIWFSVYYEKIPKECIAVTVQNKGWYILKVIPKSINSTCYTKNYYKELKGDSKSFFVENDTSIHLQAVGGKSKDVVIERKKTIVATGTTINPKFISN